MSSRIDDRRIRVEGLQDVENLVLEVQSSTKNLNESSVIVVTTVGSSRYSRKMAKYQSANPQSVRCFGMAKYLPAKHVGESFTASQ